MDHALAPTSLSISNGLNPNQTPIPVGAVLLVNNTWLPSRGQDLRWGYGGQSYGGQANQNLSQPFAMSLGVQGPETMQHNANRTHHSGDADLAGKDAGKATSRAKRQQTIEPTTIFFRNVPNNCTGKKILELFDTHGFQGSYDFVYVPHDFKRLPQLVSLGYFFVNFVTHEFAQKALDQLVGFKEWESGESAKVLDATWATQTQGLKSCIKRYKNCPVMHETVPNECKPMIFEKGVLVPLPSPKKRIKQPRFKKGYLVDDKSTSEGPSAWVIGDDGIAVDSGDAETQPPATDESRENSLDPKTSNLREYSLDPKEDSVEDMGVQSSVSAVWMSDESAVACSRCDEPFTMFRRRHHCRACGLICCAECAPRTSSTWPKILRKSQDSTFKRLCGDCQACFQGRSSSPPPHSPQAVVKNTFIDIKEEPNFCSMFASKTSISDSFPY
jgi:hypothetical protein